MNVPSGRRSAPLRFVSHRHLFASLAAAALVALAAPADGQERRHRVFAPKPCTPADSPDCAAMQDRMRVAELHRLRASVQYRILGSIQYPRDAIAESETGKAVVRFTLAPNGKLTDIAVLQSSGSPRLDRAVIRSIQLASPIPLGPQGLPAKELRFVLPVSFTAW